MTGATDVRPGDANRDAEAPTARDDVFYELLITLTSESGLALDAKAIETFREVVDRTVGDFLVSASRNLNPDLWKDEKFQRWTKMNTKKIARRALDIGGDRPSAERLRQAANEVIVHAHDEYCEKLPSSVTAEATRGRVGRPTRLAVDRRFFMTRIFWSF